MLNTSSTAKVLLKQQTNMRSLFIFILSLVFLTACTKRNSNEEQAEHEHAVSETYTCAMHPQITSDKPGKCPICGMDLVKASKVVGDTNDLMLNESQIKLANITTQ